MLWYFNTPSVFLDDPKLSSKTEEHNEEEEVINHDEELENIKKKLKVNHQKKIVTPKSTPKIDGDSEGELEEYYLHKDRDLEMKKKM